MRVCLLASGSKGNAIYVESGKQGILIDAGLSARELAHRLQGIGVAAEDLNALLVTHEHGDHCRGIGPMARKYQLPVYIHPQALGQLPRIGKLPEVIELDSATTVEFGGMKVKTFPLTHDAAAPLGYTVETAQGKIGVATDLGIATRLVADRLQRCRVLVLETNHDEDMLRDGPYPWPLKQRIRSNHGHLSNKAAAQLLEGLVWEGLEAVFLAHLSEVNNHPDLALDGIRQALDRQSLCNPRLIVGAQEQASACFSIVQDGKSI